MLKSDHLYPYGFVFADKEYKNIPGYYSQKNILNTYYYYFDNRETPSILVNQSNFIIIHGTFVHIGIKDNLTRDDLTELLLDTYVNDYNTFLDTLDFIGGRFAIMIGNDDNVEFYSDASAMRSVYFALNENIVGSHYNLLKDNIKTESFPLAKKYGSIDFTYDRSPASNVNAIMPNFKLDFNSKKLKRFFPRNSNKYSSLKVNERYVIFEKLWKEQVDYYMSVYDDVAFSLTGGNDSRISLAMLKEYKDKIRMFTYAAVQDTQDVKDKFEASHDNDRIILDQMKANLDLNHQFYFFRDNKLDFSKETLNALLKNVFRSHGRFLVAYYMKAFPKEKSLHLRANLLEIGRAFLISPTSENTVETVTNSFIPYALNKTRGRRTDISDLKNYADEQNNKYYNTKLFDYHLLDLSFWETRMGRWHAEIVNETDIAFQSVIPYNMRALIDISLSFPYEDRKSLKFFRDLINRNYPVLNFFGYNNFNNLYEQSSAQGVNIHSPYSKFKNNIFDKFKLYDNENELIKEINNNENKLYIDRQFLYEGNYVEVKLPYRTKRGHLNISVSSPYSSKTGRSTLVYEVYHNEKCILKEDMSSWKFRNNITVFNMIQDDYVKIKVKCLSDRPTAAWENASKLFIREYTEYSSAKVVEEKVSATSPESKLFN